MSINWCARPLKYLVVKYGSEKAAGLAVRSARFNQSERASREYSGVVVQRDGRHRLLDCSRHHADTESRRRRS